MPRSAVGLGTARKWRFARTALCAVAATVVSASLAEATSITLDPLHGCIIGSSCYDNGTVTPAGSNPLPAFTFTVSPGPNTGDFLVAILVPNNTSGAGSDSFSISGTKAGSADASTIGPDGSTSEGDWTSGGLGAFLGLTLANGSPKNDITAWLPYTQANGDSGATGYDVYLVDLGTNELQSPSNPTVPILTLSGSTLPIGSLLTGFLSDGIGASDYISDANSGALYENDLVGHSTPPPAPEPASLFLLGSGLVLGANALRRRKRS